MSVRSFRGAVLALLLFVWDGFSQPIDLRQGLVAYWPLDNITDNVATADATSFSNHLSLVNMDSSNLVTGRHGVAMLFNGTDELLRRFHDGTSTAGLPIHNMRRYSILMWVKGDGAQVDRRVFSEGSTNSNNPIFGFGTDSLITGHTNIVDVFMRNNQNTAFVNHRRSTNMAFDNTWHHIAWVDDNGAAQLYIDGQLDAASFAFTPSTLTMNTVAIGGLQRAVAGSFFAGTIDDVALWERTLTPGEIQQVMTNSIALPIPAFAPLIRRQPVSLDVFAGERASLSVDVSIAGTKIFQWYRNGIPIIDATNSVLLFDPPAASDSGDYFVQVANASGGIMSSNATLLVRPVVDLRSGLISYWPLDELTSTTPDVTTNGNHLFALDMGPQNIVPGRYGSAAIFDGASEFLTRENTNGFGLPISAHHGYSVALWVMGNGIGQFDRRVFSEGSTTSIPPLFTVGTDTAGASTLPDVFLRTVDNTTQLNHLRPASGAAFDDAWHHLAVVDNAGRMEIYVDGTLTVASNYVRGLIALNTLSIGGIRRETNSHFFAGVIDEVAVWRRALQPAEVVSAMNAPVIPNQPPVAQCRPVTNIVCQGCTANVTANDLNDASFDPDGTITMFTLVPPGPYSPGVTQVTLIVTDNRGGTNACSASVVVHEQFPPLVHVEPPQTNVSLEGSVTFCANIAGFGPFEIQWRHNGVNIPGATNVCLHLTNVQLIDGGEYSVLVANDAGVVLSDPALLLLNLPPVQGNDSLTNGTTLVANSGLLSGTNSAAQAEVGEPRHFGKPGGKSVWYEWTAPGTGIATFTTLGSTFDTLLGVYVQCAPSNLVEIASDDDSGENLTSRVKFNAIAGTNYLIAVDGFAGADGQYVLNWELEPVALLLPVIVTQPKSVTVASNEMATFTVEAEPGCQECGPCHEGPSVPTILQYQWSRDGVPLPGATNSSLTITNVGEADVGGYSVTISQAGQKAESRTAALQINVTGQETQVVQAQNKFEDAAESAGIELGVGPQQAPQGFRQAAAAAATVVRGYTGTQIFSTAGSTTESGDKPICNVIGGASQWITFVPLQTGVLHVNTDGSSYNTVMAVFVRSGQNLLLVNCDNNGGSDNRDSALSVPVEAGVTNFIMIDGVNGQTGTLKLNYSLVITSELTFLGTTIEGYPQMRIEGRTDLRFVLEVSTNMITWISLLTNNSPGGTLDFSDTVTAPGTQRFYRAVMLP